MGKGKRARIVFERDFLHIIKWLKANTAVVAVLEILHCWSFILFFAQICKPEQYSALSAIPTSQYRNKSNAHCCAEESVRSFVSRASLQVNNIISHDNQRERAARKRVRKGENKYEKGAAPAVTRKNNEIMNYKNGLKWKSSRPKREDQFVIFSFPLFFIFLLCKSQKKASETERRWESAIFMPRNRPDTHFY